MNKVDLVGHLITNPELQFLGDGRAVCKFRMATKSGRDKSADTHYVVIHAKHPGDKHPQNCSEILSKGWRVYVTGKLTENRWVSKKDGREMSRTEILATHIEFLAEPNQKVRMNGVESNFEGTAYSSDESRGSASPESLGTVNS